MASSFALACGGPAESPQTAAAITSHEGPCNAVVQHGELVDLVGSTGAAPTPAGGAIADGTYVLESLTLYAPKGENGAKLATLGKTTMEITGTTTQLVRTSRDGVEQRTTVTRVSTGLNTTATTTCVSPPAKADAPATAQYTATATALVFINPGPAGTAVASYRKLMAPAN